MAEEVQAKQMQEALKAEAALSFTEKNQQQAQTAKKSCKVAEHWKVLMTALKQYHAGLVATPQQKQGLKRKEL